MRRSNPGIRGIRPLVALLFAIAASAPASALDTRGHAKIRALSTAIPDDSLLRDFSDDPANDQEIDLRGILAGRSRGWEWQVDYQLLARQGHRLELQQNIPALDFGAAALPDDDRRALDLTHRISDSENRVVEHRLDRLYLGHTTAATVIRIGRQAVSWGNGLIYNPVDFFNPFDPAAIDTEYKTGDDMLYAQYLRPGGDDLQGVWVLRRDDAGDIEREVSSLAFKYHGFAAGAEYDLLLAEHYDATLFALGGAVDIGGAVWRGDAMLTDTDGETFDSAVLNGSWSWVAWNHNLSGSIEYFHNGFGIDDGDYSPEALADNPELVERIRRGELFTLGQDYLALTATAEMTPLWLLTATLFDNLDDHSQLLQLLSRHDLAQNLQFLLALNLPAGDDGSEFGGIDSPVEDRPLATGNSLFAELAWYF